MTLLRPVSFLRPARRGVVERRGAGPAAPGASAGVPSPDSIRPCARQRCQHSTKRSHRQFKHPEKKGRVTVAGKLSRDLPPGLLASILRQAGLK
jgi:hypothetical protein